MSTPFSAIPTNIILQTGNGNNLVTWNIVAGASSYNVQRSTDGVNFTTVGTPSTNLYLDTSVTVGVLYYYQVASVSGVATSPYSQSYPVSITPCLPGQINLGYLRYLSKLRADRLNSQFLTDDEWNSNLNQSAYELYDILVTKFGDDYFLAPPLLLQLTGLDNYPLPDGSNYPINGINSPAMYKLVGVDANIQGASPGPNAGWIPVSRFNWSDRDKYTLFPALGGALNNIYQLAYRQMGNALYIIPANTNQLLRIWYVPVMIQLLLDTDMLPFSISGWSEYIIVDAAIKALLKQEKVDQASALQARKGALVERIETTAANRDVGQPNTVSNVRATMGDPSFSNWGNGCGNGGFGGGGVGY